MRLAREFVAPAPLAAVALMAFNDFVLKRSAPGVVSGKLSDLAIGFFLPLFAAAIVGLVAPRTTARARVGVGVALTLLAFGALKLSPAACHAWCAALSLVFPSARFGAVADPSDLLVAIPMVGLAALHSSWSRSPSCPSPSPCSSASSSSS